MLRAIKESNRTNRILVVILTSSDSEADKRTAYDLQANSYLSKPVDFEELLELLGDVKRDWLKGYSTCRT